MRWSRPICILSACWLSLAVGIEPARGASRTVVVQPGDTLWDLAQEHGCSISSLREANELEPDEPLVVGRELDVSSCEGGGGASSREYVVKSGDTLASIAERHATSVDELRELNDIEGSLIRVGQTLRLPGSSERTIRAIAGQSIGRPDHGYLRKPTRLPRSSQYYRRRVERTYAAAHLIDHTLNAIAAVHERFPKAHRLAIGDLSDEDGGALSGHASHQSGRDIDLGLFYRELPAEYPQEFVVATKSSFDAAATWALLEALLTTAGKPGGVEKVFVDYELQGWLYAEARKRGWSKKKLVDVFQYPDGQWAKHGIVRHEPKHDDHLHVRFACVADDDKCK
ncbi:penicillin-insensitive murein endopeptidase [Nannocystaceae bacterium ST9]